ncbi:amino acid ABC transporter substrate-binding protein, PAAT family [Actinokineospora alba]|uniref:Amino acid ABC transporter substrate-binding protein, PAAT family n=1 Tax=Actinokineospora alba TaxID=504798 RepID=A0A1H0TS66_9PSEU|nr:transporter substrate-binding domain-containing protein [Actinokineospora alba]TDP70684.1 amino acid ABC transporter substrate-binding protein (PAAT family) [Actinokineospora alba]SDJ13708.1 glutamate transport system substrate-binding protein [Actinokineospora alba]SDP56824.1 amino acid ABC transporter substrate-binding protein, PAAT family [Actinokineospora alba]
MIRRTTAVLLVLALVGCGAQADEPLFGKTVNVGVAPSSPGLGVGDSAGNRSGFDHDLSNWLGERLGFTPVPVVVLARDREAELGRGTVGMVVATYSITDDRKELVGFAGPYLLSQQGVMVRTDDKDKYRTLSDLSGKTLCVTAGSTSAKQARELGFPVSLAEKEVYEQCRLALHANQVDAITTDQLILYGLQQVDSDTYVIPDITFGQQERYGIGLPKGDKAKCEAVTAKLKTFLNDGYWERFFASNLPNVPTAGHKPNVNKMNPC